MKRILIVDDHEVVRAGVMRILDQPETIFGEASNGADAMKLATEESWDMVVLDLSLGEGCGLELLKELKQARPRLPVLILSMHSEEQYARRAFQAGASGYVTKDSAPIELIKAVNRVSAGGRYVNEATAERFAQDLEKGGDLDQPAHQSLSDREFEVMRLIGSGKTVGEIAEILQLSKKTVSTYRTRILEKMGMKTNAEIIHYAIRNNLSD
ncbi:MAG TPA: response regulator transcription factor [Bryobacteraceae bacterium]|nr:response regulator transcription factor [Bryobacteraceae bacterium]